MIINNWHKGGQFSQRGLRCNKCTLVEQKENVYISAHVLGKAIDFNVQGLTSNQVSVEIKNNIDTFKYPIRLERDTNGWTHVDVYQPYGSEAKLVEFNG